MSKNTRRPTVARPFRDAVIGVSRPVKQLVAFSTDLVGFTLCACAANWLLSDPNLTPYPKINLACIAIAILAVLAAWSLGLYRSIVRYMGYDLFIAGVKTAVASAVLGSTFAFFFLAETTPIRWAIAFCGMAYIYICASRYLARVMLIQRKARVERDRVIIYGAGLAGAQLAIGLLSGDEFLPVAFVDDDSTLHNKKVKGLVIYPPSSVADLVAKTGASRVLLAIPGASRRKRRAVLERLGGCPVHVQSVPALRALLTGQARVDDIRDVEVKDLLGRDPVPPKPDLLNASIIGKNVMVTGAGGSIGSELCRQIVRLEPKTVVLFEISEFALYRIDAELRATIAELDLSCRVVAILGSVCHRARVDEVISTFAVETLYHAAAYKHVPLVEYNILEGVYNNSIGTLHIAQAAADAKIENFVLISTDKAVSPTNVMGASKRLAELILQALQDEYASVNFCMVRFGNVLESSGSVVPLFRRQIRSGGPVTVTHRDITRYFMTIPEAAQLVLQAAAMANGGDVFVLDMGKPVKIYDLALRMIRLMGLSVRDETNPEGDIAVDIVGLRPAEKLFEELLIGSDVSGTEHPRILRADEEKIGFDTLMVLIEDMKTALSNQDRDRIRELLMRAVSGYKPTNGIEDLISTSRRGNSEEAKSSTVVNFPKAP